MNVERHRDTDHQEPHQLHPMADPPAELPPVEEELGDERHAEPHEPDDDDQVGAPACERVGPHGARRDRAEEARAQPRAARSRACSRSPARRGPTRGRGSPRTRARRRQGSAPPRAAAAGERRSGLRSAGRAERASTAPPTGSTAAPEKATTPFWPVSMPGVERPWTVRIPAITAKRRAEQDRPAVAAARPDDRQDQRSGSRGQRGKGQDPEVDPAVHGDLPGARRNAGW